MRYWAAALQLAGIDRIDERALALAGNILMKHQRDAEILAEKCKAGYLVRPGS